MPGMQSLKALLLFVKEQCQGFAATTPSSILCPHPLFFMVACYFHGKKSICIKKRWQKAFFWQQWNCIVQLQKTNCPIIYDVMVECQCVLKCWGHQLYNDIGQQKVWIKLRVPKAVLFKRICFYEKSYFWPYGHFSHKKKLILMIFFL